ncbi:MAG: biotin/lipoyl-binding protein [Methylocella sp.]
MVGGRIVELAVSENAKVSTGNLLFRSDPVPYRLLSSRLKLILGSP